MIRNTKFNRILNKSNINKIFLKHQSNMATERQHHASAACNSGHVCSIIPPHLLQSIIDKNQISEETHVAIKNTLAHCHKLKQHRNALTTQLQATAQGIQGPTEGGQSHLHLPPHHSIIPSYVFQDIAASEQTTPEQKECAQHNLKISQRSLLPN